MGCDTQKGCCELSNIKLPLFDIHEGLKCTEILIITLRDIYQWKAKILPIYQSSWALQPFPWSPCLKNRFMLDRTINYKEEEFKFKQWTITKETKNKSSDRCLRLASSLIRKRKLRVWSVFCVARFYLMFYIDADTRSSYYRPPTKLREGNVFSRICLLVSNSVHGRGGSMWLRLLGEKSITHDVLYLTVQGPSPAPPHPHGTSPYRDPEPQP